MKTLFLFFLFISICITISCKEIKPQTNKISFKVDGMPITFDKIRVAKWGIYRETYPGSIEYKVFADSYSKKNQDGSFFALTFIKKSIDEPFFIHAIQINLDKPSPTILKYSNDLKEDFRQVSDIKIVQTGNVVKTNFSIDINREGIKSKLTDGILEFDITQLSDL